MKDLWVHADVLCWQVEILIISGTQTLFTPFSVLLSVPTRSTWTIGKITLTHRITISKNPNHTKILLQIAPYTLLLSVLLGTALVSFSGARPRIRLTGWKQAGIISLADNESQVEWETRTCYQPFLTWKSVIIQIMQIKGKTITSNNWTVDELKQMENAQLN
jgi:hypothetical protein